MKLQVIFAAAALAFSAIQAEDFPKRIDGPIVSFPQPPPTKPDEQAAVKFKPLLYGCTAQAAVNANGEVPVGIPLSGDDCKPNPNAPNQQVYGRTLWVDGLFGMMYAYYFADRPDSNSAWHSIVLFINNPDLPNPEIMACSVSVGGGYLMLKPCPPKYIKGNSVMVEFTNQKNNFMSFTTQAGVSQDLILWSQMPRIAQDALNELGKHDTFLPITDENFKGAMENATAKWQIVKP